MRANYWLSSYLWHLDIAKLVPQVLNGVKADECRDEKAYPFDRADTSNRDTSHHQPKAPFWRERVLPQSMELGPAENSGESEEQQHRVEENEPADSGVRVLAKHHQGHEPDCQFPEVQFLCRVVCQWDAESTKCCIEDSHGSVVQVYRVCLARLEFERAIVSSDVSREANEHFTERRVDIEVEFAFEVVGSEFTETGGNC